MFLILLAPDEAGSAAAPRLRAVSNKERAMIELENCESRMWPL